MTAKYEKEKSQITEIKNLKSELDTLRGMAEEYERQYDLNKVAEIKYGRIPEIEAKIKEKEADMEQNHDTSMLKEEITEEEISQIVSKWTGIPVTRLVDF